MFEAQLDTADGYHETAREGKSWTLYVPFHGHRCSFNAGVSPGVASEGVVEIET